jgi:hypothetical protein
MPLRYRCAPATPKLAVLNQAKICAAPIGFFRFACSRVLGDNGLVDRQSNSALFVLALSCPGSIGVMDRLTKIIFVGRHNAKLYPTQKAEVIRPRWGVGQVFVPDVFS